MRNLIRHYGMYCNIITDRRGDGFTSLGDVGLNSCQSQKKDLWKDSAYVSSCDPGLVMNFTKSDRTAARASASATLLNWPEVRTRATLRAQRVFSVFSPAWRPTTHTWLMFLFMTVTHTLSFRSLESGDLGRSLLYLDGNVLIRWDSSRTWVYHAE